MINPFEDCFKFFARNHKDSCVSVEPKGRMDKYIVTEAPASDVYMQKVNMEGPKIAFQHSSDTSKKKSQSAYDEGRRCLINGEHEKAKDFFLSAIESAGGEQADLPWKIAKEFYFKKEHKIANLFFSKSAASLLSADKLEKLITRCEKIIVAADTPGALVCLNDIFEWLFYAKIKNLIETSLSGCSAESSVDIGRLAQAKLILNDQLFHLIQYYAKLFESLISESLNNEVCDKLVEDAERFFDAYQLALEHFNSCNQTLNKIVAENDQFDAFKNNVAETQLLIRQLRCDSVNLFKYLHGVFKANKSASELKVLLELQYIYLSKKENMSLSKKENIDSLIRVNGTLLQKRIDSLSLEEKAFYWSVLLKIGDCNKEEICGLLKKALPELKKEYDLYHPKMIEWETTLNTALLGLKQSDSGAVSFDASEYDLSFELETLNSQIFSASLGSRILKESPTKAGLQKS